MSHIIILTKYLFCKIIGIEFLIFLHCWIISSSSSKVATFSTFLYHEKYHCREFTIITAGYVNEYVVESKPLILNVKKYNATVVSKALPPILSVKNSRNFYPKLYYQCNFICENIDLLRIHTLSHQALSCL